MSDYMKGVSDAQWAELKRLHKLTNPRWNTEHVHLIDRVNGPEDAEREIRRMREIVEQPV